VEIHIIIEEIFIIIIIGRSRTISTSKIKKIIVIRKNRNEKGIREDLFGSNPHSNGEHFSRSINDFLEIKEAIIIIILVINKIKIEIKVIDIIIYIKLFLILIIGNYIY
jgi:hypothetical protein